MRGSYIHHYPITFRRVLRDDALISMTSGDEDAWYAISIITYARDIEAFERVASLLAVSMAKAFGARPHWGKYCPLDEPHMRRLYPRLAEFRDLCNAVDPDGIFRNDFICLKLGL